MKRAQTSLILACLLFGLSASASAADKDNSPAKFPSDAVAILVSGSADGWFDGNIDKMKAVLADDGKKWNYDALGDNALQWFQYGGEGQHKTEWAKVETAIDNAGKALNQLNVSQQHFVYYHTGHGHYDKRDKKKAWVDCGPNPYGTDHWMYVDNLWQALRDQMTDGGKQYSSKGSETSMARSMTFILQACHSGGFIFDLTDDDAGCLGDKALRREYFPFLTDLTVLTSTDWANKSYKQNNENVSAFTKQLVELSLNLSASSFSDRSAWSAYERGANFDQRNWNQEYTPDVTWGSGDSKVMHVKGNDFHGTDKEYPCYRHTRYYPALTGDKANSVELSQSTSGVSVDVRLGASHVQPAGPVPLKFDFNKLDVPGAGDQTHLRYERLMGLPSGIDPDGKPFLDYYLFNAYFEEDIAFDTGTLTLEYEADDIPKGFEGQLKVWFWNGVKWNGLSHTAGTHSLQVSINGLGLNEKDKSYFGLAIPEPATLALLALGACLLVGRGRRRFDDAAGQGYLGNPA